jgi:group I intron endonuclease
VTKKVYIGQTRMPLKIRWQGHKDFSRNPRNKTYLSSAIRKYGVEAFRIDVVERCATADLNGREKYWILAFGSNDRTIGYNMSEGGDGGANSLSPEVRAKIAATKKGVSNGPCKEETKKKISEANKGRRRTEEQRLRIKESRIYSPITDMHRAVISKLTETQRSEIRMIPDFVTSTDIGRVYGVSRETATQTRRGNRGLRHIEGLW